MTEVFDVRNTHCVQKTWIKDFNGTVPYVTASAENNSVDSYVEYDPLMMDKGNAIVIGGKTFVVTYQKSDFFSNDSHNLTLRLKGIEGNERIYLFLAAVIARGLGSKYSWGDSVSFKKIQGDRVTLPVREDGAIDFAYMEAYIRELEAARLRELEKYLIAAGFTDCKLTKAERLAVDDWAGENVTFGYKKTTELFNVIKGKRLTKGDMVPGHINFIGATASNNGITSRISNCEHILQGNTITVSYNGSVGEAFYQDDPYWASDDINAFEPHFDMTRETALFFCAVIRKLGRKYAYSFKWGKEIMENEMLPLPVCADGTPDFAYMETLIRGVMKLAIRNVIDWKDKEIATTKKVIGGAK